MPAQRALWTIALLALLAIPLRAEEPASEPPATSARADSASTDEDPEAPKPREGEAQPSEPPSPSPSLASASSEEAPAVPTSASATTGLDAGTAVMLRCLGPDGVFSFGPGSDDFVAWAFSSGPIDLTVPYGLHYKFGVVPPVGEQCRIFREPFPPGVTPPAPPPPSPPVP